MSPDLRVVPDRAAAMDEDKARRLTERIRSLVVQTRESIEKLHRLLEDAKNGRAHVALGYGEDGWTRYLADVFADNPLQLPRDQRREVVQYLADEGVSIRATAKIVGADKNTVMSDRKVQVSETQTPAQVEQSQQAPRRRRPNWMEKAAQAWLASPEAQGAQQAASTKPENDADEQSQARTYRVLRNEPEKAETTSAKVTSEPGANTLGAMAQRLQRERRAATTLGLDGKRYRPRPLLPKTDDLHDDSKNRQMSESAESEPDVVDAEIVDDEPTDDRHREFVRLAHLYADATAEQRQQIAAALVALRLGNDSTPMPADVSARLAALGTEGRAFCGWEDSTGDPFTYRQVARLIGRHEVDQADLKPEPTAEVDADPDGPFSWNRAFGSFLELGKFLTKNPTPEQAKLLTMHLTQLIGATSRASSRQP